MYMCVYVCVYVRKFVWMCVSVCEHTLKVCVFGCVHMNWLHEHTLHRVGRVSHDTYLEKDI